MFTARIGMRCVGRTGGSLRLAASRPGCISDEALLKCRSAKSNGLSLGSWPSKASPTSRPFRPVVNMSRFSSTFAIPPASLHHVSPPHVSPLTRSRSRLLFLLLGGSSAIALLASSPFSPFGRSLWSNSPVPGTAQPPFPIIASSPSDTVDTPSSTPRTPSSLLNTYILEPILTFFRFLHLAFLFGPVILTVPMLYVGSLGSTRTGADGKKRWRKWKRRVGGKVRGKAGAGPAAGAGVVVDDDDMGIGLSQGHGDEEEEERWGAVWWYGFLVKQMERAGPTFIKLGQWAASRADLFPASLCDLMGKLHSNGKPHGYSHTKQYIEAVFGLKMEEIFEDFGKEPIGCGAIAQVYRARLRREILPEGFLAAKGLRSDKAKDTDATGQEVVKHSAAEEANTSVAIKVLHPRVESTIRRDLAIMNIFASAINLIPGMNWLSLPEEVEVFGQMMNSQLDLRVEADNLDRFHENFKKRGTRGVSFPRPIRLGGADGKGTGSKAKRDEAVARVLVEEFEDALPLKYFLRNGGEEYDDRLANIGLDAFLNMLLIDNWTHGDLHPGNIMVRFYKPTTKDILQHLAATLFHRDEPDEVMTEDTANIVENLRSVSHDPIKWKAALNDLEDKGYEPELIFIDAGLVTALNTDNRRNFLDLFQAVAEFDGYRAGQLMVERCRTPELVIDKETFALKMQHLVLSVKSKTFSLAAIKISDILTDVLAAVRQHHVKMEGDFVNTVISILLLEGIGRQLDPNMDLFKSAVPIMRQLGRQMGTKEAISHVDAGNIWALAKVWLWVEAREVAGFSSSEKMDEYIRFDRFMPNI